MSARKRPATIHPLSNGDLRAGRASDGFEDPSGLTAITPEKRSALLSNPALGADDEPARLFATVDAVVVGRIDLLADTLDTPDGPIAISWGSSLLVSPEARGQGVADSLLQAAEESREGAGVGAPSRQSYPLYLRRGYLDLPLRRSILVRHPRPLVEHRLGGGAAARVGGALAEATSAGHRGLLAAGRRARRTRLASEPCPAFPRELEARLRVSAPPFSTRRSAAWLDWVVQESFGYPTQRRALHLVSGGSGEIVAYFLVKARVYSGVTEWGFDRLHLGSLVDWCIFEPAGARFEQLVLLALDAVAEWDVDAIEVCLPPDARGARLRRYGFFTVGEQHVMLRGTAGGPLDRPEAREPGSWWVRPGDGDHVFS